MDRDVALPFAVAAVAVVALAVAAATLDSAVVTEAGSGFGGSGDGPWIGGGEHVPVGAVADRTLCVGRGGRAGRVGAGRRDTSHRRRHF